MSRAPAPDWIPRDSDTFPSQAMPSAGFTDWREQADWWEQTCNYWRAIAAICEDKELVREIRDALESDSNDAEHDALVSVANALGIDYTDPDDVLEDD